LGYAPAGGSSPPGKGDATAETGDASADLMASGPRGAVELEDGETDSLSSASIWSNNSWVVIPVLPCTCPAGPGNPVRGTLTRPSKVDRSAEDL
jgi:hypothetical protein